MTTRHPSAAPGAPARANAKSKAKESDTGIDLTSKAPSTSPAMPHERDEGVGMTGGTPSARVQQGHRDMKRGVQDTSRAPEADNAYRKLKK